MNLTGEYASYYVTEEETKAVRDVVTWTRSLS